MSETIHDVVRAVTGKEHDEVLADRIAQLEAALAEKEAALAAAHEALRQIASVASEKEPELPTTEAIDDHFYYGMECIRHQHGRVAREALGAPTLQSAAKLDRLRRAVVDAVEANEDFLYEHGDPSDFWSREVNEAYNLLHARLEAALAALRAEEEKG